MMNLLDGRVRVSVRAGARPRPYWEVIMNKKWGNSFESPMLFCIAVIQPGQTPRIPYTHVVLPALK
jgi:hypothetical protein